MFAVSVKGIYGLSAMYELAVNYNKSHIQIKEIASTHNIPQHYLEQLLIILKKAGLVKSYRGNQGGYALARNPHQIKIMDILQSLEGELLLIQEENRNNVFTFFWDGLKQKIREELDISLEELLLKKQKTEQQVIYTI